MVDLLGYLPSGHLPCDLIDESGRILRNCHLLMVSARSPVGTLFSQINRSVFGDYCEKLLLPRVSICTGGNPFEPEDTPIVGSNRNSACSHAHTNSQSTPAVGLISCTLIIPLIAQLLLCCIYWYYHHFRVMFR